MTQLQQRVMEVFRASRDDDRAVDGTDEVLVPWQVYTLDATALTVHYFTNAFNELVTVRLVEEDDLVRVGVVERRTSNKLPGQQRAQTVTLSAPLAGRAVVDATTGLARAEFVPDVEAGWAAFDVEVAWWLLLEDEGRSLAHLARTALRDGCDGKALERLAAGEAELTAVYRERGMEVPDLRAAAKRAVDAGLAEALADQPYTPTITYTLGEVARSGRMDPDQFADLAEILALCERVEEAEGRDDPGSARERLVAAARAMSLRGGLVG